MTMHELTAAQEIVDAAVSVAKENNAKRIKRVSVEIGQLAFIPKEHFEDAFSISAKGTMADGAELLVKIVPARYKCTACGASGALKVEGHHHDAPEVHCPKCGAHVALEGSNKVIATSIKVEV
jgi:hydrogenase nickel incorporation protein HypA/HybF